MSTHTAGHDEARPAVERTPADVACRRAWWSLLLYPVTLVASLMIGGGLFSLLDDRVGDIPVWVYLVAVTPALLVVVIPGVMAVIQGRRAIELGRPDGRVPAVTGTAIGAAFVVIDLLMFILG
jgi:hypothetical protein